ncbi:MAG: phosphate regulon sensor protein PhoR, partial [Gammaproteobacteria bacterium]
MMLSMPNHWQEELRLFLGAVLTAGLAGALTEQLLPCLLLGLLVYLGWHVYQLTRLTHLLGQDGQQGPRPYGLWRGVIREIQALYNSDDTRKRELSYQLESFRDTVNTLPDAVVILDPSGLIDWSNTAAGNLLGIVWPDAQGHLLTALAPDPLLGEYLAGTDFSTPVVITSPANRAKILSVFIAHLTHG